MRFSGCRPPARGTVLRRLGWPLALAPALAAPQDWVASTPHFRLLARESPGLGAEAVAEAATDLEAIRQRFLEDGLGEPSGADAPLDVLLLPTQLEMRALLRDPPDSGTRGVTIRGLDRNLVVVAWHASPGPWVTLAHEYAHQVEEPGWPLWFREGRAVELARRIEPQGKEVERAGMLGALARTDWIPWPRILAARDQAAPDQGATFQAQAWLLFHWLAERTDAGPKLKPDGARKPLAGFGAEELEPALRAHAADLRQRPQEERAVAGPGGDPAVARPAAAWEVPLFQAEARRELRQLDAAEWQLAALVAAFPEVARIQAAHAALQLVRGRQDLAERHFGRALELGDRRARTAYRYALLLMRPGKDAGGRASAAARFARQARDSLPTEPLLQLALAQARMLQEAWDEAFQELRRLAGFAGWEGRADREAREVRRRRAQAAAALQAPGWTPAAPEAAFLPPRPTWMPPAWPENGPIPGSERSGRGWPPADTWIVQGRIAWVDCSEGQRRIVVHSPYQRLVLRERPDGAPRLINRPFRARRLPCGSRGWSVAVAYRKLPRGGEVAGEIVAIRF